MGKKVLEFKKASDFKERKADLEMSEFYNDLVYLCNIHLHRKASKITIIGGLVVMLGKMLAKHDPTCSNSSLRSAIFQHILNHQGKEILDQFNSKGDSE
jgi:hypothetical protein